MNKQMITFSFRTTPEAVRTLKKQAQKRKTSCGALLREMIEQIPTREESHEREPCQEAGGEGGENHSPRFSLDEREVGGNRKGPIGEGV